MFSQRKQQKKNYIVLAVAYDLHANIPWRKLPVQVLTLNSPLLLCSSSMPPRGRGILLGHED
jgi:hypothetical protein